MKGVGKEKMEEEVEEEKKKVEVNNGRLRVHEEEKGDR